MLPDEALAREVETRGVEVVTYLQNLLHQGLQMLQRLVGFLHGEVPAVFHGPYTTSGYVDVTVAP